MTKIDRIKAKIGKVILKYRVDKKMTQRELAAKSKITETSIRNIESGRQNITIETLVKIKQTLNINELFI